MEEQKEFIDYINNEIPDVEWVFDEKRNAFDTFMRALLKTHNESVVFMECDVILCEDFRKKLEQEIWRRPNEVLQFFSMRKDDLTIGTRKMLGSTFSMNQCHYFPQHMPQKLYDYYFEWKKTKRGRENPNGYDYFMADFFHKNKISYWIICPNLVNHRQSKSMIGGRSSKRQSKTFNENI